MKDGPKRHFEVIQIVIALLIVFVTGYDMIGKTARPAILLTLICASMVAGVNIRIFVEKRRSIKKGDIAE